MLRKQLHEDLQTIERGEDPKGVIRDPAKSRRITLPIADREHLQNGSTLEEMRNHPVFADHLQRFIFQAGQPRAVWDEFCIAMGIDGTPQTDDLYVIRT